MYSNLTIEDDNVKITVFVVNPIPYNLVNEPCHITGNAAGVTLTRVRDKTKVDIPSSNIVCIVSETKNAAPAS